jgi:hypothetical protein
MNKKYLLYIMFTFIGLKLFFLPQNIFAAELNFKILSDKSLDSASKVVEVRIDPKGKMLNVIDGVISFDGSGSDNLYVQVENGNSILSLWPTPPIYDKDSKSIHFIGGIPNGFDKEGLLFVLKIDQKSAGDLSVLFSNGFAYLNDGKGTQENISSSPLAINGNLVKTGKVFEINKKIINIKDVIIILSVIVIAIFTIFYVYKKNIKK